VIAKTRDEALQTLVPNSRGEHVLYSEADLQFDLNAGLLMLSNPALAPARSWDNQSSFVMYQEVWGLNKGHRGGTRLREEGKYESDFVLGRFFANDELATVVGISAHEPYYCIELETGDRGWIYCENLISRPRALGYDESLHHTEQSSASAKLLLSLGALLLVIFVFASALRSIELPLEEAEQIQVQKQIDSKQDEIVFSVFDFSATLSQGCKCGSEGGSIRNGCSLECFPDPKDSNYNNSIPRIDLNYSTSNRSAYWDYSTQHIQGHQGVRRIKPHRALCVDGAGVEDSVCTQ
jgi:hypothetical protein